MFVSIAPHPTTRRRITARRPPTVSDCVGVVRVASMLAVIGGKRKDMGVSAESLLDTGADALVASSGGCVETLKELREFAAELEAAVASALKSSGKCSILGRVRHILLATSSTRMWNPRSLSPWHPMTREQYPPSPSNSMLGTASLVDMLATVIDTQGEPSLLEFNGIL